MMDKKADYFEGISYSITYNNYSNTQDSVICNIISNNIKNGNISPRIVEVESREKLSMYSHCPFRFDGFSVLELKESIEAFGLVNRIYDYSSIYQYIVHQKAMLFLDTTTEEKILNTDLIQELKLLDEIISNYDENIWREYALRIMISGVSVLVQESLQFTENLKNRKENGIFYAIGSDDFWNTSSSEMELDKMLIPKRGKNMNVFGKILTLCNIDKI